MAGFIDWLTGTPEYTPPPPPPPLAPPSPPDPNAPKPPDPYDVRNKTSCVTCGGRTAKKKYASYQEAAQAQVDEYNSQSISANREFGGYIERNADGTFSPGETYEGGVDGIQLPGKDGDAVAMWHTHGAFDPNYNSEVFSTGDMKWNQQNQLTGYLGTPSGAFKVDYPDPPAIGPPGTGTVVTITPGNPGH